MLYISHLLPDSDMREIIEKTNVGVESIEFSIADNLDHFTETLNSYKARLKDMGSEKLILHGPFLDLNPAAFDSLIRQATYDRFAKCYEAGVELGAKKIVYHSGMCPQIYFQEGWAERVADFFEEFMRERTELEVTMENVLDPLWESVQKVGKLVTAKNFHLCFDMGHAHCYSKQPVLEWTEALAEYVTHLHIHDNDQSYDTHRALGEGTIPWKALLQKLPAGETRTWTIECMRKEDVFKTITLLKENGGI